MLRRLATSVLAFVAIVASALAAHANPARIIVLRHGEKADDYRLCSAGVERSRALANRYLGRGADASLFPGGSGPDAFFAITLHTLELISPVAMTWRKPVVTFSALPVRGQSAADKLRTLNERTQEAAADVMTNWARKTIVMVWEHHHIADQKLADSFPDQKVTLRQLLNLEAVDSAPKTLPDDNYDYFWIADYDAGSPRPTRFEMVKQSFPAPYQQLPSNEWGKKALLPRGCKN